MPSFLVDLHIPFIPSFTLLFLYLISFLSHSFLFLEFFPYFSLFAFLPSIYLTRPFPPIFPLSSPVPSLSFPFLSLPFKNQSRLLSHLSSALYILPPQVSHVCFQNSSGRLLAPDAYWGKGLIMYARGWVSITLPQAVFEAGISNKLQCLLHWSFVASGVLNLGG